MYSLEQFAQQHSQQVQACAHRLAQFSEAAFDIVQGACRDDLIALQQHLETFNVRADGNATAPAATSVAQPVSPAAVGTGSGRISVTELLKSRSSIKQQRSAAACTGSATKTGDGKSAQEVSAVIDRLAQVLYARASAACVCLPARGRQKPLLTARDSLLLNPLYLQEYAYTMAAAYRSEQRRLLSFLRMADFMMCDTLQTILLQSVSEMLAALEPSFYTDAAAGRQVQDAGRGVSGSGASSALTSSSGGRSLQVMANMINSSRRQRASLAVAGMQLQPVTAAQQQAAAEAAAAGRAEQAPATPRPPLLEMDVVMSSSCDALTFVPELDQFQVGAVLRWA